jgi:serine/threonine protein kinase
MEESNETTKALPQTKLDTSKRFTLSDWSVPDEFEQLGVIGRGAFGHVLCVRRHGKLFALKLFDPREVAGSDRARPRFVRGARIMKVRLQHPGVVAVHDIYGEGTLKPAFLMDYIPGPDLQKFVRDESADARALVLLIGKVAEILDYAHRADIVHRDVKPRNVLVLREGDALRPIITDFDLAYEPGDESLSLIGDSELAQVQIGTAYMHPEFRQNFDRYVDGESVNSLRHQALDYYSLCMTLYFVLTGWDPSNDAAMEKRLGEREVSLRGAFGTRGLTVLHGIITGALSCATVAELPQLTRDLKRQLDDALSKPSFTRSVAGRLWTAPSASDFRSHYGAPKAVGIRAAQKRSMFAIGGLLLIGGIGWVFGGAPIVFSAITVAGIASILCRQAIIGTIDRNPPVLPTGALWAYRLYPLTLWAGRGLFLAFFASAGAFALDLTQTPALLDFREQMVTLRSSLSKPEHPQNSPAPSDTGLHEKDPPITEGDSVDIREIKLDATIAIRMRGKEHHFNLDRASAFRNTKPILPEVKNAFDQEVARLSQSKAVVLRYDAATKAIALDQRGRNLSQHLIATGWLRSLDGSLDKDERAAMEQGNGLWSQSDCATPCTFGSGCATNRKSCNSGWRCMPPQEQLVSRRWELYLLGASAEGASNLQVCALAYGKRGCLGAEAASQTQTGLPFSEEAGLVLDNGVYGARVWMKSTGARDATETTIFSDTLSLLVTPESICQGFNINSKAEDGRRITLRFRLHEDQ